MLVINIGCPTATVHVSKYNTEACHHRLQPMKLSIRFLTAYQSNRQRANRMTEKGLKNAASLEMAGILQ